MKLKLNVGNNFLGLDMIQSNLSVLLKELIMTSRIKKKYRELSSKIECFTIKLTKPVFKGADVIPLVEDNVEDDHDADHDIEGDESCHW